MVDSQQPPETEIETETEQHDSNYDREIQPGDVVRDMWSGKKLYVTQHAANSVREWDEQQSDTSKSMLAYEGSIATGATIDDRVYRCVFIKSNASFSAGKKNYDYPESRLGRFAHETANGDDLRTQDKIRAEAFARLMTQFDGGNLDVIIDRTEDALTEIYSPEFAQLARGLFEARR